MGKIKPKWYTWYEKKFRYELFYYALSLLLCKLLKHFQILINSYFFIFIGMLNHCALFYRRRAQTYQRMVISKQNSRRKHLDFSRFKINATKLWARIRSLIGGNWFTSEHAIYRSANEQTKDLNIINEIMFTKWIWNILVILVYWKN